MDQPLEGNITNYDGKKEKIIIELVYFLKKLMDETIIKLVGFLKRNFQDQENQKNNYLFNYN
jgi:hypothetical protein